MQENVTIRGFIAISPFSNANDVISATGRKKPREKIRTELSPHSETALTYPRNLTRVLKY